MTNDKKGVALALVVTFLVLMADEVLDKNRAPKPRRIVAFAVVFLMLGFLSEIQSTAKLAKTFSVLVLIGTVYAVGPTLYKNAQTKLGGTRKAVQR